MTTARPTSAQSMTFRRSSRSLSTPPGSRKAIVGTVIPMPTSASAAGAFQSSYACQAIATRKMPSPTSETVIPAQSRRKSRCRSGARRLTREKPPGRSSASWLCCMRLLLAAVPRRRRGTRRAPRGSSAWRTGSPGRARSRARAATSIWSGSSIPSATTSRFRLFPSAMIAAASPESVVLGGEERAVHLEDVDREAAQVGERRVAGAEVVHRQQDAERLQLVQPLRPRGRCRPSSRTR